MTDKLDEIPFVDVRVRLESLEDDLYRIVQSLFPGARREDWSFEELQGKFIQKLLEINKFKINFIGKVSFITNLGYYMLSTCQQEATST